MADRGRGGRSVFLLSPAHCGGKRAQSLLAGSSRSPLAERLRDGGVPIGDVFSVLSGLYFRGKLAYGRAFARPSGRGSGVLVIVPGRGLVPSDTTVGLDDLRAIARIGVSPDEPRFSGPLERDASGLAATLSGTDTVILLGSIATGKYVDILVRHLGDRLHFPADFVGRGDMSRGGLMLRSVAAGQPLATIPVAGATRHGPRPPRLVPVASPVTRTGASAPRAVRAARPLRRGAARPRPRGA